jgi:hypothetical protein
VTGDLLQALTYVLVAAGLVGIWLALRHSRDWALMVLQGVLYARAAASTPSAFTSRAWWVPVLTKSSHRPFVNARTSMAYQ